MSLRRRWLIALGSLSVCCVILPGNHAQEAVPTGPTLIPNESRAKDKDAHLFTRTGARKTAVVSAVERVKGAVVNIHSERNVMQNVGELFPAPASQTNRVNGMGTGIIIDPRGYIVTNQHVVDEVTSLRIRLCDGTTQNAMVVARNPELDLAIIKIDAPQPLQIMPMGTASDLMVGETVIAIGNAYGYEHTVSLGIVSAIKRDVSLNKEMSYKQLIQTDASINPGNSGGPLVNINGELVGVNVAIRAGAQGIGFAIPVDHMVRAVSEMMKARRRVGMYDGLSCRDILVPGSDGLQRKVVVERVDPSSPADTAGLRAGDVMTQVGDVKIDSGIDVERGLLDRKSGETVPLVVRRKDQEQRIQLALASGDRQVRVVATSSDFVWQKLGVQLVSVSKDRVARVNNHLHGGLEVKSIQANGLAAKAGIVKGDIIVGLHKWETVTLDNVTYVLNHPELITVDSILFYIVRDDKMQSGKIQQVP